MSRTNATTTRVDRNQGRQAMVAQGKSLLRITGWRPIATGGFLRDLDR